MKLTTREMVLTALFAAIFCILGPISVPIGPVPVSLTNFVIYISVYMLSARNATISCLIYLLIGAAGLPVFSGYTGGAGKLLGVTGGYLIGFIFTTVISGIVVNKFYSNKLISILGMLAGLAVTYAFGTAWFAFLNGDKSVYEILKLCVIPFILIDFVKIIIASIFGPILKSKINSISNGAVGK